MIFGLGVKGVSAAAGVLLMTGVIIGSAVVLADDGGFGVIEAPAWDAGYAWAYDLTADFGYDIFVPGEVDAADTAFFGPYGLEQEVLATQFDHDGAPIYISASNFPLVTALDTALFESFDGAICADRWPAVQRQADLAAVPTSILWDDDSPCEVTGLEFGRSPTIQYIDFPISKGDTWGDTIPIEEEYTEDIPYFDQFPGIAMKAEVGGMQTLDLPVGKTQAVRIDFAYRPIGLDAILQEIREDAEAFGAHVERLDVRVALHNIVHYSPTYENIVRDEWLATASADIAVTIDGYDIELDLESYGRVVAELTGAQLIGKPEKSLGDIYDVLSGRAPLAQVVGKAVADPLEAYEVSMTATADEVNAAEAPVVSFETDVHRADGLPAGHGLVNSIYDGAGQRVFSSLGDSFEYVFSNPGVYTVTSEARDGDGGLWALDATTVVADYNSTVEHFCGLFYVSAEPWMGGCSEEFVPVNAGIKSLYVAAEAEQILGTPSLGMSYLELHLPDGSSLSDPAMIYLAGDALEDYGMWRMDWVQEAAIAESATYYISLDYDAEQIAPHQAMGGAASAPSGMGLALQPVEHVLRGLLTDRSVSLPSAAELLG